MAEDNMAEEKIVGRCMKCKENKEMRDTEEVTMKNGGTMVKGICVDCGRNMCKIVGKKKAE